MKNPTGHGAELACIVQMHKLKIRGLDTVPRRQLSGKGVSSKRHSRDIEEILQKL